MTENTTLSRFTTAETQPADPEPPSLEDRLLVPVSPTLGLRLIPGTGDPFYLKNRGQERYLFRDKHDRWIILQPSAKDSEDAYVRWIYLPDDKPARFARTGLEQRTVVGYDYIHWADSPDPIRTTVTGKELTSSWGETVYECGECGETFEIPLEHALHCWDAHPWIPTPGQVRLENWRDD